MIKFRRGSTSSWRGTKLKLEPGQPGYDKNKHKIKVGDGEKLWPDLPYATGLFADEVLDSETNAKTKQSKDAEDSTLITYGTEVPDDNTVGRVYLQEYDTEPETDYIVSHGTNGIWTYQKWKSGIAKCFGVYLLTTDVQTAFESIALFQDNNKMKSVEYPITFKEIPTEIATLQGPGCIAWLASKIKNTRQTSGVYTIISPDKQLTNANFAISLQVEGIWK